jgi:predicted protein tyrosine phosphatase
MNFILHSRAGVENAKPRDERHLIISIRTPGDPREAKLPINDRTRGVLRLSFDDIPDLTEDVEAAVVEEELKNGNRPLIFFNDVMAREILDFVRRHKDVGSIIAHYDAVGSIIVHCDAGVSRSPAVAAGIAKTVYGQDDDMFFIRYCPNTRVYRLLTEEKNAKST